MKVLLPVCTLLLVAGCSEPVQTEPFLNGQLEVIFEGGRTVHQQGRRGGTLNLQTRGLGSNHYSFSGTLTGDSEVFQLEGEDAQGTITGTLTNRNSSVYTLLGRVDYDREEAASPSQPEPSGQLAALCKDGPCIYRSISIDIPEQATP